MIAIFIEIQISTSNHLPAAAGGGILSRVATIWVAGGDAGYRHSGTLVLFRPITEYTEVDDQAHPRFADAVESRGTPTEIREW